MIYVFIAVTLLGWGAAGIFDKKAVETSSSKTTFVLYNLFNVPVLLALLAIIPFVYDDWSLSRGVLFWEGANAVAAIIAIFGYYHAVGKTQASWVFGITAGYPIVAQLLAVLFLGEIFSLSKLLAALLVSAGIALIGYSAPPEQRALPTRQKWIVALCVALATFLWAALGIFEKASLGYARPLEAYLALSLWKSVLALLVLGITCRGNRTLSNFSIRSFRHSWTSAALVCAGNLSFVIALAQSSAGYLIVVTAAYPLVMYVLALRMLSEKLSLLRVAGIVVTVLGAVVAELSL